MRPSVRRGLVAVSFALAALAVAGLWLLALPPDVRGRLAPGLAMRAPDGPSSPSLPSTADAGKAAGDAQESVAEAQRGPPPARGPGAVPAAPSVPPPGSPAGPTASAGPGTSPSTASAPASPGRPPEADRNVQTARVDAKAPAPAPTAPVAPSFDIVRVEPSGESVIAGRAGPGATVELLRGGEPLARALADPSGLFAFVPPALPPGANEITLRATGPDGVRAQSRESVLVEIAPKRDARPLVTLSAPDRPTVVLSMPETAQAALGPDQASTPAAPPRQTGSSPPPGGSQAEEPRPRPRESVRIASVDAEEAGRLFVSGQAAPGASVRLYLNDTLIAPGSAGPDGRIAFAIGRGIRPGNYRVRLDDVDPVTGEVKTRAEVAFAVPEPAGVASIPEERPGKSAALAPKAGGGQVSGPFGAAPGSEPVRAPAAAPAPAPPPERSASPPPAPPLPVAAPEKSASVATSEPAPPPAPSGGSSPGTGTPTLPPISPAAPSEAKAARSEPELPPAEANRAPSAAPAGPPAASSGGAGSAATASSSPARDSASALAASSSGERPQGAPRQAWLTPPADPASRSLAPGGNGPSPAAPASAEPGPSGSSSPGPLERDPSIVLVPEVSTALVSRGENLWRISRRTYGRGMRYTTIFGANKEQIRNPDLIYPGQVFVLPSAGAAQP